MQTLGGRTQLMGPRAIDTPWLKDVLFCKPRLFRKYLQIWSAFNINILRILAFLAAAFTSDIPLSKKQTVGTINTRCKLEKKAGGSLKRGHNGPLAVISFWEHEGART